MTNSEWVTRSGVPWVKALGGGGGAPVAQSANPSPASKVAQVPQNLISGGASGTLLHFFPASKILPRFSRHTVGVPIVHHTPLKKYGQPIGEGGGGARAPVPPVVTPLVTRITDQL